MKSIVYEGDNNSKYIINVLRRLADISESIKWTVNEFEAIPYYTGDYSGVGKPINDARQRVYDFSERILKEHSLIVSNEDLMSILNDVYALEYAQFQFTLYGEVNRITIFEEEIISFDGAVVEGLSIIEPV